MSCESKGLAEYCCGVVSDDIRTCFDQILLVGDILGLLTCHLGTKVDEHG